MSQLTLDGHVLDKVAYQTEWYRQHICTAYYLADIDGVHQQNALIEISGPDGYSRRVLYPAYRIWNIAAHFTDIVNDKLAETEAADGK